MSRHYWTWWTHVSAICSLCASSVPTGVPFVAGSQVVGEHQHQVCMSCVLTAAGPLLPGRPGAVDVRLFDEGPGHLKFSVTVNGGTFCQVVTVDTAIDDTQRAPALLALVRRTLRNLRNLDVPPAGQRPAEAERCVSLEAVLALIERYALRHHNWERLHAAVRVLPEAEPEPGLTREAARRLVRASHVCGDCRINLSHEITKLPDDRPARNESAEPVPLAAAGQPGADEAWHYLPELPPAKLCVQLAIGEGGLAHGWYDDRWCGDFDADVYAWRFMVAPPRLPRLEVKAERVEEQADAAWRAVRERVLAAVRAVDQQDYLGTGLAPEQVIARAVSAVGGVLADGPPGVLLRGLLPEVQKDWRYVPELPTHEGPWLVAWKNRRGERGTCIAYYVARQWLADERPLPVGVVYAWRVATAIPPLPAEGVSGG